MLLLQPSPDQGREMPHPGNKLWIAVSTFFSDIDIFGQGSDVLPSMWRKGQEVASNVLLLA